MLDTTKDFYWATSDTRTFMSRGYLKEGVTVEQRVRQIADHAGEVLGDKELGERIYSHIAKGYISLSTPIWCNFGLTSGLPISCFGSYVPDSMDGIASTNAEVMMMSKYGGGTSSYWGDVRPRLSPITNNGLSEGSVNFMRLFNTAIDVSKQGESRRGVHAVYQRIDHGDIEEFLDIRGDGNEIQHLFPGVLVPSEWMVEMIAGDKAKRKIWAKVLESRAKTGTPYIVFTDNMNDNTVDVYKDKGLLIKASNVCTEIALPSNEEESFVCDLLSINALHFDKIKGSTVVQDATWLLDAVMTEFIEKASKIPFMERSVRFAERHRALGIGVLGYFSLLQSKMIPFESKESEALNIELFSHIKEQAYIASAKLAEKFGEPEVLKGYGRRNTTLTTVAPTTSSAFILGQVSQSIEPPKSNYFVKSLAKIKVTTKNEYLERLLEEKGQNTEEVWASILVNDGSVQHLDFLSPKEKAVFKTFGELSQVDIVKQAADRQHYIDQSQSLNLMIHPKTPIKDVNKLYIDAWAQGIKSLYYQHSLNAAQSFNRDLLLCSNCEA